MRELTTEQIKTIREKLKECKSEWLEKNAKGQDSLGVLTVTQILDYAAEGIWDFVVEKEWREEVNKFNKGQGQWQFDGYVYHVRGSLNIEGLGKRSQYGSKVAIGGKDNQNSSYKSAASDCLKKCASLFGVGSSIYSKIKIETEEEQWNNYNQQNAAIEYNQQQLQNQQNYMHTPQVQQQTLPNGDVQQGEYIWSQQQQTWIHQSQYQQQAGQYPTQPMNPVDNTNWQPNPEEYQMARTIQATDQAMAQGAIETPFENVPPKQEQQAQQQSYEAQPQGNVEQNNYQANQIQYGAPVDAGAPKEVKTEKPEDHIKVDNPWDSEDTRKELAMFQDHKKRLNISDDNALLPHVREYFKDGSATISSITPDTLKGFNAHLQNIQA